ncbi:hypothetical protein ACQ4PT_058739 [Festuca glaucescens]
MNLVRGLLRKSPNPAAAPAPASPSVRGGGFPGADLDDAPAPRVVFRYAKVNELMTRCTIGTELRPVGEEPISIGFERTFAFTGQMGPVYVFSDALSSEQINGIYNLGPSYMYSFHGDDSLYRGILDARDGISSKIIFGLNAQEHGWNSWLETSTNLDVIKDYKSVSKAEPDNVEINELILVRNLYSLVLSYYLSSVKGGWHQLEDTAHFFLLKFDQGQLSSSFFLRDILDDIVESLLQTSSEENIFLSQPGCDNVLHLLKLIQELLFNQIGIKLLFPSPSTTDEPSSHDKWKEDIKCTVNEILNAESNGQCRSVPWSSCQFADGDEVSDDWWSFFDKFMSLLPFLIAEDEQSKNKLHFLIWSLLIVRSHYGQLDDGARFHVLSHLILETIIYGKSMLVTNILGRDDSIEVNSNKEAGFILSFIQKDRVLATAAYEVKHMQDVQADRLRKLRELHSKLNEYSTKETQLVQIIDDQIHFSITSVLSVDDSRKAASELAFDEDQQIVADKWIHIFRALIDERGPWSANPFPNDVVTHWKLDKTEDKWRRRFKLKRNYMFDERLCQPSSSRNENTEPYDDQPSFSTKVPEKMKRFLLKGVRGITDDSAYRPFEDTNDTSESSHNPSENQNLNNAADLSDHRTPVQNKKDTSSTNTDNDYTKIKGVHWTRYLLQYTAMEIFFDDSNAPIFLNFSSQKDVKNAGSLLVSLRNDALFPKGSIKDKNSVISFVDRRVALEMAENTKERWRRREISNFEYLMSLNTLAGRSYNDLTQYPIFPWVLADYASENLDFNMSSTFRDLSKPVGALDEKRFKVFEDRYLNFCDPDIPSFYYGSHYSSMGIVLHYLLRLEPFTTLHRSFQGGKFDHADRLFQSIDSAYKNSLSNTSDVKELIPEFFYMPEFLQNSNSYHLGVKQDGELLGDVALPPWAKGSPEEFIHINREALESEYVSSNLHHWIDLIFGYKQRGQPAVEASNIFYYVTYEGAVDLENMDDMLQKYAIEDQIANFGQTPIQIFRVKHPRRGPPIPIAHPLYFAPQSITLTSSVSSTISHMSAVLFIGLLDGTIVLMNEGLILSEKLWLTTRMQLGGNFTFSGPQENFFGVGPDVISPRKIGTFLAENVKLGRQFLATMQINSEKYLILCGNWENSFQIISLCDGRIVQSIRQHKDVVGCVAGRHF